MNPKADPTTRARTLLAKFPTLSGVAGLAIGLALSFHAHSQNLTQYVSPFCGTQNDGNTFPGAVVPFGMVQWSPDTTTKWPSGYRYTDTQIRGFGLLHASGAGCNYGGDFGFLPVMGNVGSSPYNSANFWRLNSSYSSTITGGSQHANPGYYSVQFSNGIKTELTATTRTGFGRFTYPSGNSASMLINMAGDNNGTIDASIQINPNGREISGWTRMSSMCGTAPGVTYFHVVFDRSFTAYGVWNGTTLSANGTGTTGANTGAYVTFNLPGGGVVLARTALSHVSVANAQANLASESPSGSFNSAGFNTMQANADTTWNNYLNKIQVSGGSAADTQTFYTAMYHSLLSPSVVSDVNRQYIGFGGTVRTLPAGRTQYGWFSGWDIYRNECQFIAMMDPVRASDMAQSLVQDAQDGGTMPRWSGAFGDGGIMVGDCSTPIIAGMYAFGARSFDTTAALTAMEKAATVPNLQANNGVYERPAVNDYLIKGFVAANPGQGGYGPVSMTLEYCIDDFAMARLANAVGDTGKYSRAMKRAQNWRNLYNASSGYLQMRDSNAQWSAGFPTYSGKGYVEGTAYQYVWNVPFNLATLINLMGGASNAAGRLDDFFTQINNSDTTGSHYAFMGNEPCAATPWVYHYVGQPYKTSSVVRRCVTQLYSPASNGLPGNDDLGQTSSWYVWAALGMYPAIAGDDLLTLHGPLFPQAILHLANGNVTITGNGAGPNAPYVQSHSVNGQSSNAAWIRYSSIANGGTLAYNMGAGANTGWGASNPPPSYTDGMAIAGPHAIVSKQNGIVVDNNGSTVPQSAVVLRGASGGQVQRWSFTQNADTSWNIISLFSGQALDVPGGSTENGITLDQWGYTGGSNQRWWVDQQADGSYKIWNVNSSAALDNSSSSVNGHPLIQWGWSGGDQQRWFIQ